jgi:hypothetical protein
MSGLGKLTGLCLGLAILAVVTAPDVARGQVARSPSEITIQLRTGTQYIRKALENLESQQAQTYVRQAYFQLRDAQAMMQNANGVRGFPYALYAIAIPQVSNAKTRALGALTALQYPAEQGGAPVASTRLNEALQITETVLLTLF